MKRSYSIAWGEWPLFLTSLTFFFLNRPACFAVVVDSRFPLLYFAIRFIFGRRREQQSVSSYKKERLKRRRTPGCNENEVGHPVRPHPQLQLFFSFPTCAGMEPEVVSVHRLRGKEIVISFFREQETNNKRQPTRICISLHLDYFRPHFLWWLGVFLL